MDEWFEYLYIMGALTEDDYRGNSMLKSLVYEYNNRFPNWPLEEDFFFDNTQEEQMQSLLNAIRTNEPIIRGYTK
jgi:hypothetical protein